MVARKNALAAKLLGLIYAVWLGWLIYVGSIGNRDATRGLEESFSDPVLQSASQITVPGM